MSSLALIGLGVCTTAVQATILTFDQIRQAGEVIPTISGRAVEQDYGDRVASSPQAVAGGQFTYGESGEGFTPNVVMDYLVTGVPTGGVSLWEDGYGDLTNVLFGNQNSGTLRLLFTADSTYEVELYGFDLAGWPNADYVISEVRILSGGSELFSESDVEVAGSLAGPRRTSFAFAAPVSAQQLALEIDYSNLLRGQQDNIGIDNVRFGQNPSTAAPIPEPSTLLLVLFAGAAGAALRRKQSCHRVRYSNNHARV